jgi:hypothetical protein
MIWHKNKRIGEFAMNNPRLLGLLCVFAVTLASTLACNHDSSSSGEQLPGSIALTVNESMGSKCVPDTSLLEGATVTAKDTNGFFKDVSMQTDNVGYAMLELEPGIYDLLIEAVGHESVTVEDQQVFSDTETDVGDVTLREDDDPKEFNQDRAILLAQLAMIAYAQFEDDDTRRDWIMGNFIGKLEGDSLPYLNPSDPYVKTLKLGVNAVTAQEYISCWEFFQILDRQATGGPVLGLAQFDTQVFIATKVDNLTEDIVVSFRGTDGVGDAVTDVNVTKGTWALRRADGTRDGLVSDAFMDDSLEITRAVDTGFRNAYEAVAFDIQKLLNLIIVGDGITPGKITDTSKSRVYFTGHSLGSSLAVLAALDLADYLVKVHGYNRNNIIMYGYGVSRILTEKIRFLQDDPATPLVEKNYQRTVPNSFSVTAHDDPVSHVPGIDADTNNIFPAEYIHNEQLMMLSTNIIDSSDDGNGRYISIGKSRLDRSNGRVLLGCDPTGRPLLGDRLLNGALVLRDYGTSGHDQLQYIKRIENLVDTSPLPNGNRNGFPAIGMRSVDTTPNIPITGERVQLIWDGSPEDSVMGNCDWVALYKGPSKPTDHNDYECKFVLNRGGFKWVVNGDGYPGGVSSHITCEDPLNNAGTDTNFWIGYVDGFNRIINTRGPYKSVCTLFGGLFGNICLASSLVLR